MRYEFFFSSPTKTAATIAAEVQTITKKLELAKTEVDKLKRELDLKLQELKDFAEDSKEGNN